MKFELIIVGLETEAQMRERVRVALAPSTDYSLVTLRGPIPNYGNESRMPVWQVVLVPFVGVHIEAFEAKLIVWRDTGSTLASYRRVEPYPVPTKRELAIDAVRRVTVNNMPSHLEGLVDAITEHVLDAVRVEHEKWSR